MKKLLFMFVALSTVLFTSCDDDEEVSSTVEITVKKNGEIQTGVTVCMFSSEKGYDTYFFNPMFADKKVVTEGSGVASFELQEVYDLDVIDTQTTLYFAVFKGNKVLGKTALTIKKGENKTAVINY